MPLSFGNGSKTFFCRQLLLTIGTMDMKKEFQNILEISDQFWSVCLVCGS